MGYMRNSVEAFPLHLNQDRARDLMSPIVLVPIPVTVSVPVPLSVNTPLKHSQSSKMFFNLLKATLHFNHLLSHAFSVKNALA